jgi:MFS family permease
MARLAAQLRYGQVIPITLTMLLFGIASGAAMIPYSVIKEVNPDNVKGSATGAMNFLVFGITAAIGPIFAQTIGKTLGTTNPIAHFQASGVFWMTCCIAAGIVGFLLRETGHAASHSAVRD